MGTATQRKPAEHSLSIGDVITIMAKLRDTRRELAEQDKILSAEYHEYEQKLISMMDAQGTAKSATKTYTASIQESTQFNVQDWEAFMKYVARAKAWHLVQRRVSAPSVREVAESKGVVPPGLEAYLKREVSLRVL